MKKLLTKIAIVASGLTGILHAQQDPQFTQFMFNRLIYNPGYAGTSGAICGVAQYRKQWASFPGAPTSIAFAGDMRLSALPLGVGLNVMTDKIGQMSTFFMRGAASWNVPLAGGHLGIGLDLGVLQTQINNNAWITPESFVDNKIPGQTQYATNPDFNKTTFDLGFGAFYNKPGQYYGGISTTHIPAQSLKDGGLSFKVKRHYYFVGGATLRATGWLDVEPNVLYKTDFSASRLDLNVNLKWFKKFWVGGTVRTVRDVSGALLLGGQQSFGPGNNMTAKLGYSYDFPTTPVSGGGSHEIILGFCMTPKIKVETSYGNDRYWGN